MPAGPRGPADKVVRGRTGKCARRFPVRRFGRQGKRAAIGMALAAAMCSAVDAQSAVPCAELVGFLESATGLSVQANPAAAEGQWRVLDGARLAGEGAPRITVQKLRMTGAGVGELQAREILADGLRVAPALNDRDMPDWLRDLMRLQTADLHLSLRRDEVADTLVLDVGQVALSGGMELTLAAEMAGARLSGPSLLAGRLLALQVDWKNDGRSLRPVMEAFGAKLEPGAKGSRAVDAARAATLALVEALPPDNVPELSAKALGEFVSALPQGRGRLVVNLSSEHGIGAAQLGVLALSDDPGGMQALGRFLYGTRVEATWTAGLTP